MEKKKVLYIAHEMSPFLELTDISSITRNLPQSIQDQGYEIRVLMPRFGCINERRNRLHEVIRLSGMNIVVNDNDNPLIIKVASIPGVKMQVYFLENDDYFQRKFAFRDAKEQFYEDNDERAIFFCKGAIETIKKLGWKPDIIHCHDWMSSLVPMFIKTAYKNDPMFQDTTVLYSVYKNSFNEKLDKDFGAKSLMSDMVLNDVFFYEDGSNSALHLGAIHYADGVIIGSKDIEQRVKEGVENSGKPVLPLTPVDNKDLYNQFYQQTDRKALVTA